MLILLGTRENPRAEIVAANKRRGKTLYALSTLLPSLMKEEKRRVVACGIQGLLIDHEPVWWIVSDLGRIGSRLGMWSW